MSQTVTLSEEQQKRFDFLEERRKGIGGSDAAAAVGISPWKTPYDLYLDKVTPTKPEDMLLETPENFLWGNWLEPLIRQRYCDRTGNSVQVYDKPFIAPNHPFARYNTDGTAICPDGEERVLEIKAWSFARGEWGDEGTNEIPAQYMCQVQHGMACTGLQSADVIVLLHGNETRLYHVPRDQTMIDAILFEEERFWERVCTRTPPDPENSEDVNRRWSVVIHHDCIVADDELVHAWEELRRVREEIKVLSKHKEALELKMKMQIKDMEGVLHNEKPIVTWKQVKADRFDTKAFRAAHPQLAAEFTKSTTHRKFLCK